MRTNVFTTREECKQKLEEVTNFAIQNDLSVAIMFREDLFVHGAINYRIMYGENYQECLTWLENITNQYLELTIPPFYASYINGEFIDSFGMIIADK